jgi:hypothetical protein
VTDLRGLRAALNRTDAIGRALYDELAKEPEIKRRPEWDEMVAQAEDMLARRRRSLETAEHEAMKRRGS